MWVLCSPLALIQDIPVFLSVCPNDAGYREAAEVGPDPLPGLPHSQAMVDDMVHHSGPDVVSDSCASAWFPGLIGVQLPVKCFTVCAGVLLLSHVFLLLNGCAVCKVFPHFPI